VRWVGLRAIPDLGASNRFDLTWGWGARAMGVVRAEVGGLGFLAHDPRIYLAAGIDSQVLTPPLAARQPRYVGAMDTWRWTRGDGHVAMGTWRWARGDGHVAMDTW
jgi:hypothetical protein